MAMAAAGNTTPSTTTQRVNLFVELQVRLAAERWLLKARNLTAFLASPRFSSLLRSFFNAAASHSPFLAKMFLNSFSSSPYC
jgi:hypothetical protein